MTSEFLLYDVTSRTGSKQTGKPTDNENVQNLAMASSSVLNFNVGVLGHVDSGKTSLAKAISTVSSTAAFDKNPQSQVDFGVLYQNKLHRWMIRLGLYCFPQNETLTHSDSFRRSHNSGSRLFS